MRTSAPFLALAALAAFAPGCLVAAAAVVETTREPVHVAVVDVPPPAPMRVDGTPPPPGFDPAAAQAAVEAVDLAACWVPGSTHGAGTARITFNPTGDVGLVEILNPVQGASIDQACASQRFNTLRMTPFSGPPISVTAKIFVG